MPVKRTRTEEELPHTLSDDERLNKADELANAVHKVESSKENKKIQMQHLANEVKIAEARRDRLSNIVASGIEYRTTGVEERIDWGKGKFTKTRLDTGEIFFERELTEAEKQVDLIGDEGDTK